MIVYYYYYYFEDVNGIIDCRRKYHIYSFVCLVFFFIHLKFFFVFWTIGLKCDLSIGLNGHAIHSARTQTQTQTHLIAALALGVDGSSNRHNSIYLSFFSFFVSRCVILFYFIEFSKNITQSWALNKITICWNAIKTVWRKFTSRNEQIRWYFLLSFVTSSSSKWYCILHMWMR